MRDGNAPVLARWMAEGTHHLVEWETDLSSQTGASQAGILLGSNEGIPAFRWVEKATRARSWPAHVRGRLRGDRTPARHRPGSAGRGGGASRACNLLSGEADDVILTVSRMDAEKRAPTPATAAFLANGFNVTARGTRAVRVGRCCWSTRSRDQAATPWSHSPGRARRALSIPARDAVRRRARSDRVRRPRRHMMRGRPAVSVRDPFSKLRRGRPPFRARTRRHAFEALPQARPDSSSGASNARRQFAPQAVQAGRALRPRADPGRHVQTAATATGSTISFSVPLTRGSVAQVMQRRRARA